MSKVSNKLSTLAQLVEKKKQAENDKLKVCKLCTLFPMKKLKISQIMCIANLKNNIYEHTLYSFN